MIVQTFAMKLASVILIPGLGVQSSTHLSRDELFSAVRLLLPHVTQPIVLTKVTVTSA